MDQKNSDYEHFSRSVDIISKFSNSFRVPRIKDQKQFVFQAVSGGASFEIFTSLCLLWP